MKVKLKSGEIIEVVKNDDFSPARFLNKETSEYVFDEEIECEVNDTSSWKPSDLQMRELKKVCGYFDFNPSILRSLYTDLQKLQEQ